MKAYEIWKEQRVVAIFLDQWVASAYAKQAEASSVPVSMTWDNWPKEEFPFHVTTRKGIGEAQFRTRKQADEYIQMLREKAEDGCLDLLGEWNATYGVYVLRNGEWVELERGNLEISPDEDSDYFRVD